MPNPKCTAEQIEAELVKLRLGGFTCAVAYLEQELKKRQNSKGRGVTYDDKRHRQMRDASRRYRDKRTGTANAISAAEEPESDGEAT